MAQRNKQARVLRSADSRELRNRENVAFLHLVLFDKRKGPLAKGYPGLCNRRPRCHRLVANINHGGLASPVGVREVGAIATAASRVGCKASCGQNRRTLDASQRSPCARMQRERAQSGRTFLWEQ